MKRLSILNSSTILVLFILTLSSCLRTKHIPPPSNFTSYPMGLYTKVTYKLKWTGVATIKGELIAVEDDYLFIKSQGVSKKIFSVQKDRIRKLQLQMCFTRELPVSEANNARVINTGLTLTHGWFGFLTMPLSHAVITSYTSEKFVINYPKNLKWSELSKFSRFPAGVPVSVNLSDL